MLSLYAKGKNTYQGYNLLNQEIQFKGLSMVADIFNPSIQETVAGGYL